MIVYRVWYTHKEKQRQTERWFCIMHRDSVCHFRVKQTLRCFAVISFFIYYLFHCIFLTSFLPKRLWTIVAGSERVKLPPGTLLGKASNHKMYKKRTWKVWNVQKIEVCTMSDILTYVWLLNTSDGALVQTLSPSNPITLLHMFIFGSNGLFAITISPLKRKHTHNH